MATYYGYKERDIANEIDWAKTGVDFSAKLNEEAKRREDLKDEIDKGTDELKAKISDTPSGMSDDISTFASKMSESTQNTLLMLDKSFKSGRLNYRDFVKARGNIDRGVDSALKVINEWNGIKSKAIENYDKLGESDKFAIEMAEQYGKFSKVDFVFDDNDYSMKMVLRDENGKVKGFTNPSAIAKRLSVFRGGYDVLGEMKKATSKLSPYTTEEDIKSKSTLEKSRDAYIKSVLNNPFNASEVLISYAVKDSSGNAYEFTTDKKEAGGNKIYMSPDFDPELDEGQIEEAKKILESAYNSTLYKEKPKEPTKATAKKEAKWENEKRNQITKEATILDKIATVLGSSDENEVNSALSYIITAGGKSGILSVTKNEDGIVYTQRQGKNVIEGTIPFNDPDTALKSLADIMGVKYIKDAYDEMNVSIPGEFSSTIGEASAKVVEEDGYKPYNFDASMVLIDGNPMNMSDYFDQNIDLMGNFMYFKTGSSLDKADNLIKITKTILNNSPLPSDITKNIEVSRKFGDHFPDDVKNAVVIEANSMLDKEVLLPVYGVSKQSLKTVLSRIYNAISFQKPTTVEELFANLPNSDALTFKRYNVGLEQPESKAQEYSDDKVLIIKTEGGEHKMTIKEVRDRFGKEKADKIIKQYAK